MNYPWLAGTGVAVVTPFENNGQIDWKALERIIEYLIEGDVTYLVALGTTGESATLSKPERESVFQFFFEKVKGRLPVIMGIGGNHTAEICQQIKEAETYEPAAILSVSPYYNKPTQAGIKAHYEAIARATSLPIILYNVPGRTSSNISADTSLALARQFDHIIAIKEASGDFAQIMRIIAEKPAGFEVVSGDDALTLPMMAMGAKGVISVSANAFPAIFSKMVNAALAGDFAEARQLHYDLLPIMGLHFAEGNPAGVKASMMHLGVCGPTVRLPLVSASDGLHTQLNKAITLLNT